MTPDEIKKPFLNRNNLVLLLIAALWLLLVIFAISKHEFWRDEVRDLSIARSVSSPFELVGATQNEGHPLLWYLLLFAAKSIVDAPWVLPAVSVLVSLVAVLAALFFSPFKLWFKCLLIFGSLILFENTVMARPYGLSFLLLAVIAALYRNPQKHPLWLGIALALLANANVHSAILASLIGMLWVTDWITNRREQPSPKTNWIVAIAFVIVAAGLLTCALTVIPSGDSLFAPLRANLTPNNIVISALTTLARPDLNFSTLMPAFVPPALLIALYYAALIGLIGKPKLLGIAVLAQMAFGVLFQTVYPASARHQGVFLVFLVFLYWLLFEPNSIFPTAKPKFNLAMKVGLQLGLGGLLLANLIQLKGTLWPDITGMSSSSAALGSLLNTDPRLRDAIIVPEPDYLMDALPYYADNRVYYPRESRFGTYVSWTLNSRTDLSLAELIAQAKELNQESGLPVVIVLGFSTETLASAEQLDFSYNKTFTWSAADLVELTDVAIQVVDFREAYGDENYTLYLLK